MSAIGTKRTFRRSLDHFVGMDEQRWWHAEAECLSRLRLNQVEPVNVKRRCQRATAGIAHRQCTVHQWWEAEGTMMEHHLQALVFIIYFVVTMLVLYDVHQSRL